MTSSTHCFSICGRTLLDRHGRRHPAGGHPAFHELDDLIDLPRIRRQAGQEVVVILRGAQRREARQFGNIDMHTTHLGDGHPFVRHQESPLRDHSCRKALQRHALLRGSAEQIIGQNILSGQACAVDFADALEHVPLVRFTSVHRRRREIGQLVVVPMIADAGGKLRVLPQGPLPLVFEECVELRRFLDRRGSLCASRRGWRQEQRREKPGDNHALGQGGPYCQSPHGSRPPIDVALNSGCRMLFRRSQIEERVTPVFRENRTRPILRNSDHLEQRSQRGK